MILSVEVKDFCTADVLRDDSEFLSFMRDALFMLDPIGTEWKSYDCFSAVRVCLDGDPRTPADPVVLRAAFMSKIHFPYFPLPGKYEFTIKPVESADENTNEEILDYVEKTRAEIDEIFKKAEENWSGFCCGLRDQLRRIDRGGGG